MVLVQWPSSILMSLTSFFSLFFFFFPPTQRSLRSDPEPDPGKVKERSLSLGRLSQLAEDKRKDDKLTKGVVKLIFDMFRDNIRTVDMNVKVRKKMKEEVRISVY